MLNDDEKKKQLELFREEYLEAWDNRQSLGRMWYDIYNMKFFCCGKTKALNMKPEVTRFIKVNGKMIELHLRPQIIKDNKKIKYRYLTDIDEDIFNYILFKASQNIIDIPKVFVSLNEISKIFGYDKKRIKESLFLLTQYKVDFESDDFDGVMPNQFLESVIIERGKYARTCVSLSKGLYNYVKQNRYVIMNYDNLFQLHSRISKILFKRINITNIFDYSKKNHILRFKESIIYILKDYGIGFETSVQKKRLFEEIDKALDELIQNEIITSYKKDPILNKNIVMDFNLTLFINDKFAQRYAIDQKLKKSLEEEQIKKISIK